MFLQYKVSFFRRKILKSCGSNSNTHRKCKRKLRKLASYKGIRVVKNMVSCRTQAHSNGNYIYRCTLHIDIPKKKKKKVSGSSWSKGLLFTTSYKTCKRKRLFYTFYVCISYSQVPSSVSHIPMFIQVNSITSVSQGRRTDEE